MVVTTVLPRLPTVYAGAETAAKQGRRAADKQAV
jgi:hypothetical protein